MRLRFLVPSLPDIFWARDQDVMQGPEARVSFGHWLVTMGARECLLVYSFSLDSSLKDFK